MKIVIKSYPGHKGRPGKVGGSAPRSGGGSSMTDAGTAMAGRSRTQLLRDYTPQEIDEIAPEKFAYGGFEKDEWQKQPPYGKLSVWSPTQTTELLGANQVKVSSARQYITMPTIKGDKFEGEIVSYYNHEMTNPKPEITARYRILPSVGWHITNPAYITIKGKFKTPKAAFNAIAKASDKYQ